MSGPVTATCHGCGHTSRLTTEELGARRAECPWCGTSFALADEVRGGEGVHRTALVQTTKPSPPAGLMPLVEGDSLRAPGGLVVGAGRRDVPSAPWALATLAFAIFSLSSVEWGPADAPFILFHLLLSGAAGSWLLGSQLRGRARLELTVDGDTLVVTRALGPLRRARRLALAPGTRVDLVRAERAEDDGSLEWVIDVVGEGGRRLEIGRGAGLREDEAAWIAEAVRAEVAALRRKALPGK